MDKIINMKTHILLIELATRTHSTMFCTDDKGFAKCTPFTLSLSDEVNTHSKSSS